MKKKILSVVIAAAMALCLVPAVSIKANAAEGVAIDETNFPDEIFREYVSSNFDSNKDGNLDSEEINNVTDISIIGFVYDVENKYVNISNLKGIELFTELESLRVDNAKITSLDISKNPNLAYLFCSGNQLTDLDVSKNSNLICLWCNTNAITSLDISKNTKLEVLECGGNNLTSLDVSKNANLDHLFCPSNQLTSLDISKNTYLTWLDCDDNQLASLDTSKNDYLETLYCSGNQLTSLDISKNTNLGVLDCTDNQLTSLDISKNNELNLLRCCHNKITSLDISKNPTFMEVSNANSKESDYYSGAVEYNLSGGFLIVDKTTKLITQTATNPTTTTSTSSQGNKKTTSTTTPKTTSSYSNEWVNGKWYNKDGSQTYKGTMSWKKNAKGWWIEDSAGWYPVSQWQKIDGKWYYFNASGYMESSCYRDGCWLGSDGAWNTSYSGGKWTSNATGWWFEDSSGWYPVSQWVKINGTWYYFKADGYMATSQYIGGYWVDANGACQ